MFLEQKSTKKSEDNLQDSKETKTTTTTGDGIDMGLLMQMLAAHFKQSMLYINFILKKPHVFFVPMI